MMLAPWQVVPIWVRAPGIGGSGAVPLSLHENENLGCPLSKYVPSGPKKSLRKSRLDMPALTPGMAVYSESGGEA